MIFVLTHEYSDKSGFDVCGATTNYVVASTWMMANDENNVYPIDENDSPKSWSEGHRGWKQYK